MHLLVDPNVNAWGTAVNPSAGAADTAFQSGRASPSNCCGHPMTLEAPMLGAWIQHQLQAPQQVPVQQQQVVAAVQGGGGLALPSSAAFDRWSPEGPLADSMSLTATTSSSSCPLMPPAPCQWPPTPHSGGGSGSGIFCPPPAMPPPQLPPLSAFAVAPMPSALLVPNAELLACAAALPSARSGLQTADSCSTLSRASSGTASLPAAAAPSQRRTKRQPRTFEEHAARVAEQQQKFMQVQEAQQRRLKNAVQESKELVQQRRQWEQLHEEQQQIKKRRRVEQQQQQVDQEVLQWVQQQMQQDCYQQQQLMQSQQQDDDLFVEDAEWTALLQQAVQPPPSLQPLPTLPPQPLQQPRGLSGHFWAGALMH